MVTRFELDLAPGVKASKVTNISRDLARSMSMASVRVVEVIRVNHILVLKFQIVLVKWYV